MPETAPAEAPELQRITNRFAPVELEAPIANLPENERRALAKLVEAARVMDTLFLRQVWAGNETLLVDLLRDSTPVGRARLQAVLLNKGPWSRLDDDAPFVPGVPSKPEGAAFYPPGANKSEVEQWLKAMPLAERAYAEGFFTTVRRSPDGRLRAVPYSEEYQSELGLAAALLREAAELTAQPTLKSFLSKRADAFLSNDYYESDVAWMELDSSIEPTIGPYEVYEDKWFNAKAAFEAFITVRDDAATAKLASFGAALQQIEDHLPIEAKLRNPKLGAMAPIRVVNSIFSAGDANSGVQAAAFNLPNDERVAREKGTKRVMLKNVQEAKFEKVLLPISKVALDPAAQEEVSFEAFFTHILMHELMHGLGPHSINVADESTTVRAQLQETYSAIEEAKADISGLWALQFLIDKGTLDKSLERSLYITFLASSFRSIRFGINEAHGKGIALQLNYLLDAGAYRVAADGTFAVDMQKIKPAVTALTAELMTLEAHGDKAAASELLARLVSVRPPVQSILDKLASVPVDITPRFVTAQQLVASR